MIKDSLILPSKKRQIRPSKNNIIKNNIKKNRNLKRDEIFNFDNNNNINNNIKNNIFNFYHLYVP